MTMSGDYDRALDAVRSEILGTLWTEYSPILALALNKPTLTDCSVGFRADTEDSLAWFSYAELRHGIMSCVPPGSSQVSVSVIQEGDPTFIALQSKNEAGGP